MDRRMFGSNLAKQNLVKVQPPPPQYTIDDYTQDARQKNRISEDQQMLADRVLKESDRVIDQTRLTTEQWKKEADFRLKERMIDIQFLLDEAMKQKKTACLEEEALQTYKKRLMNAIKFLKEMGIKICEQCIILRENRLGIEMTNDEVDQELKKEVQVITKCQETLDKTLDNTTEQIRRLRGTIYLLDRDLSNKSKSYQIDEVNLVLRPNQLQLSTYEGDVPLDPYNTTNQQWIEITQVAIENTAKEINTAKPLRSYVDLMLKQVVDDLTNQVDRTNEAFLTRISETRYAKNVLESIHCQTVAKVNDITRNITKLEVELAEKEGYLAVCQMRLANRAQRPGVELCKDQVQDTLFRELEALRTTCATLNKMLTETKATLRFLLSTQVQQEEDINLKANSLKIDECDCMVIRQGLNFTTF